MSLSTTEIMAMAAEFKARPATPSAPKSQGGRVKIVADSRRVGDQINGHTITGFGKTWVETVRDEDACAYGLRPGMNHRVSMQYAYFN
jgi:hypothetical protein